MVAKQRSDDDLRIIKEMVEHFSQFMTVDGARAVTEAWIDLTDLERIEFQKLDIEDPQSTQLGIWIWSVCPEKINANMMSGLKDFFMNGWEHVLFGE